MTCILPVFSVLSRAAPCRRQPLPVAGAVVLLVTWIAGCGQQHDLHRVAVAGRVTLDGAPLRYGSIMFVGASGPRAGAVIREGIFAISRSEGPAAGDLQVEIRSPRLSPEDTLPDEPGKLFELVSHAEELLPARYNSDSELRVTAVANSANEFEFSLQSDD